VEQKSGAGNHDCRKWAWAVMSVVTSLFVDDILILFFTVFFHSFFIM